MPLTWAKHEILKPPTDAEMAVMEPEQLMKLWQDYHDIIRKSKADPYRYGMVLENWKRTRELLTKYDLVTVFGGNRCLAPTQVIDDPVTGESFPIGKIDSAFFVEAYDLETGKVFQTAATAPFVKTKTVLWEYALSNGQSVFCTETHTVLSFNKTWAAINELYTAQAPILGANGEQVYAVHKKAHGFGTVVDFEVSLGSNYVASGIVHHNSSKTTCGAWLVVDCLMKNPNSLIVCFAQNAELSVLVQQTAVYDQLPAELRTKALGAQEYISYTRQNGFTGNSFILPNGSRCLFKTYSQFQQNSTVLEGLELGSWEANEAPNLGAWCDEYLGGPELLNTLLYRLVTRNAKCLLTFTPIEGYTETVRLMMDGAETLEWKTADLLNNRQVPYVQKVKNRDAALIYFHTKDNPFSGYERMAKDLGACNEAEILCRAYGIATKSAATKFPKFDVGVNVLPHDKMPKADAKGFTRYLIVDPAGSKNWFMVWIAVDESDTWYVYREWPDVSVGEWGAWKGNKWIPGDGAKGLGYGLRDYVNLINELETGEDVFERWMDPRLGKATYQSEDGASCLIDELSDAGLWFQPAPGLDIEQGIQAIQSKLAWNEKKPRDSINRPHFYISERCKNLIWALQEYTGEGGREEQPKDPIDCLRYAATVPIRFMDASKMKPLQRFEKYY